MADLNLWFIKNLGDWTVTYPALWLIIAAGLALVLIIVLIAVAICHAKNKKRLAAAQSRAAEAEKANAEPAVDEAKIREDVEKQVRAEYDRKLKNAANDDAQMAAMASRIEQLNDSVKEKQNRIDELTSALEQSNANKHDNSDFYRTINELHQTVTEQENEINLLKAENTQIKAQALQKQLADKDAPKRTTKQTAETTAVKDAPATTKKAAAKPAAKAAPAPEPEPEDTPDEEDEYDEYYDDYGDANSAIKVTLKFDRTKGNWVILRSDTTRAYRRCATKQEALPVAKDLARRLHAQLAVHKKDGKFQKV